jgi:phosphatidylglycerol:prolipoprotein diacylglycerol transferase
MRRVLLRWGSVTIYSYPTLLYFGMVCGIFAERHAATLIHLDAARTVSATLILLVPALMGARLLFVVSHWSIYRRDPRRIWRSGEGGAAMYGGLLLAVPLSVPLLAVFQIPFGSFWDVASFTMLVGMIFARAGCFLNGCCGGRPTTGWLGLNLPDDHGVWRRRIPTQILEALWGLAVLAGAISIWGILPFPGALFLYTLGAYGAGRAVLESTRQDQDHVLGLALHRTLSTAFVAISLVAFAVMWFREPRP